jgi:hypothetical protein
VNQGKEILALKNVEKAPFNVFITGRRLYSKLIIQAWQLVALAKSLKLCRVIVVACWKTSASTDYRT